MTAKQAKTGFWKIKDALGININTLLMAIFFWLASDKMTAFNAAYKQVGVNTNAIAKQGEQITDVKSEADRTQAQVGNIYLVLPQFQIKK